VSGGGGVIQWYKAPSWQRFPLEPGSVTPTPGSNGIEVYDIDGDGDLDIVTALFLDDLTWWENPGVGTPAQGQWTRHAIDTAASGFHHDLVRGDIDGDGEDELVALYVGGDIYLYDMPADPKAGNWPRTRIKAGVVDPFVGLALADLDNDTKLDILASNKWYRQPASPFTPDWTERTIFASAVQNLWVIDMDDDGFLDVVGAEGFVHPNGRVLWAKVPADPLTQSWTEHVVGTNLDGPENLWAGDLDWDGDVDLLTGEMGTDTGWNDFDSNLIVYENLTGDGTSWTEHIVSDNGGVSARLTPIDIDGDGDFDFTADGNAEGHIYLWINNSPLPPSLVPALPTPGLVGLAAALVAASAYRLRRARIVRTAHASE